MWLYQALSRVFPRSFTAKVLLLALGGTHVPLLVLLLWLASRTGSWSQHVEVVGLVLVATIAGTAVTLWALRTILTPLIRIEITLADFEERGIVTPLPFDFHDEIGRLMVRANRLVLHVDRRLTEQAAEAATDPLTGLLNRRGFVRQIAQSRPGAVLVIDIDHFKAVNDRLGHAAGDSVLCAVAAVLRHLLRAEDVVARLGGEEFVVLLPETDAEAAIAIGERLRAGVEMQVRAGEVPITISVGTAGPRDGDTAEDQVHRADMGVYAAKTAGRNRVMPGPPALFAEAA